ncbi:glycosyltransferase [Steroidobacter cummioxidans]|uniref:glycosyltransferase n=1 Tax=Steroidobacter cummioxidans TaxID=1803913 RepID=UPI000E30B4FA|nr:glycosyltransferase [Steroidobacter cummioxidans]
MKFLVLTYGSDGDTRPLAALSRALIDAGHEAHLLAEGASLGTATALGVPATPLAGNIRDVLGHEGAAFQKNGNAPRELTRMANENAENWLRSAVEFGRGCDAIVISGLAGFVGLSAAEYLGVQAIGAGLFPLTPTSAFASPLLPPGKLPRMFNRMSQQLINSLVWRAFRKSTNAARQRVCALPPRKSIWVGHPMLYGVSPNLLPRPDDWPSNTLVCGQWLLPAKDWTPPARLSEFLAAGEAPIYIGFGSMGGFEPRRMLEAIVGGLAGRRALFYPGWSGIDVSQLPANILAVGDTPHDWLLPRTAVAVHHGGSGTTHSASRAGIPSVVVPFAGDQAFWAERLYQAGIAAKLSSWKALNATTLADSIRFAEQDDVRARAQAIGEKMRKEDGLQAAVKAIESLVS